MTFVAASETPHRHMAYGLAIDSAFPLPALAGRHGDVGTVADVFVRSGPLPSIPHDAIDVGPAQRAHGASVWLSFDGTCQLCVRQGREIVVDGAPNADAGMIRLLVQGVGLGVLLQQRGLLSLHASAVAVDGVAAAFLGAPGAGKSTMAAALRQRGHAMIADDVVGVDLTDPARPLVDAGFPQLKLSAESAAAVGQPMDVLEPLRAASAQPLGRVKYGCPVTEGVEGGRLVLARVYLLDQGPAPSVDVLSPQAALFELIRHTFASGLLASSGVGAAHLRQCAALVAAARVRRLTRPFALAMLADVAALVEHDCARA